MEILSVSPHEDMLRFHFFLGPRGPNQVLHPILFKFFRAMGGLGSVLETWMVVGAPSAVEPAEWLSSQPRAKA